MFYILGGLLIELLISVHVCVIDKHVLELGHIECSIRSHYPDILDQEDFGFCSHSIKSLGPLTS